MAKHWLLTAWQCISWPFAQVALELAARAWTGLATIQRETSAVSKHAAMDELSKILRIVRAPL
jgi:hypothetical protein